MIELRKITKSFGPQKVLCGLTAVLPEIGVVAVRGNSGSGKTTLLRIIANLENADSGEILGLENKRVSYVFQEDRLLPHVSALENISIICEKETALQWLNLFGLGDAAEKKPTELSGGMRRRVAAARALAYGADILLLDEPFTGLDSENISVLKKEITRFAETGLVLLVNHGEDTMPYDSELIL